MQIELECIKRASGLVEILKANKDDFLYYLNGNKLSLQESLTCRQHSPPGFRHGYAGSGLGQLALYICLKLYPLSEALIIYEYFKRHFIVIIPYKKDFLLKLEVPDDPLSYWKI